MSVNIKLSEEQYQSVKDHLQQKWRNPPTCPMCSSSTWAVDPQVRDVKEADSPGKLVIGGIRHLFPVVVVCCTNCGYTALVNLLVAGAFTQESLSKALDGISVEKEEKGQTP